MEEISTGNKKAAIESMFDSIAWRYDFLNHFLSFGIDNFWRRKAVRIIAKTHKPLLILDIATGTADLAVAALKLNPEKITGIDISGKMLSLGSRKIKRKGLSEKIELIRADSEHLPFPDNYFDVTMAAFGVRNFDNPLEGLKEMKRVLRQGGLVMVLEFSKPVNAPFRQLYNFYFLKVLPFIGRLFSGSRNAYRYLPDSVMNFPDNESFLELLRNAGLEEGRQYRLTGGIASIYTAIKP